MKFKLGKQWIEDPDQVTAVIRRLFDASGEVDKYVRHYEKGTKLFSEGDPLTHVYILLEGIVELNKKKPNVDSEYPIISLEPGSLIGIIAYTTGEPSLTTARASEDISLLKIPEDDVRVLIKQNARFKKYMDELILANLLERFRNTIILQMKLDSVNNKLREERNELQNAYRELKEAQDMLIYQEKMATLGQLVAGFAHEVNNPTASLLRSTETLKDRVADLLNRFSDETRDKEFVNTLYKAGRKSGYPDTATIRQRVKELKKIFTEASQIHLRLLAQLPQDLIPVFQEKKILEPAELEFYLNHFELGKLFHNIESAGNRIAGLVRSLKSYSRSDMDHEWEEIDIREGIHDTLELTSNRIKYYDIEIDLPEVPMLRANPAALNQVWTNIILNAADAMGKNGALSITCNNDDENIWVEIRDTGPGIPEDIIGRIFESNFSTKKSEVKFGLGIGLSISRDIIDQHGGTISAKNSQHSGAIFTITLPLNHHPD